MIDTSFQKVKVNQVVFSQLPSFVQEENPLFVDFLKTYYTGQEYQGSNIDITQNFNEYQKVETYSGNNNLIGFTTCTSEVSFYDSTINVVSTDGWPDSYGLLKINNEIISYTGKTKTSFTGCFRGFSGVESLHHSSDPDQLVFSQSSAAAHKNETQVINLSNLFLQEFWKKTKELFLPGFEDRSLSTEVDKANFLRQVKDFYASKGTDDAVSILFRVLFAKDVEVIKPINYLVAPSDADYVETEDIVVELISGDPLKVIGQTLRQSGDDYSEASIFNVRFNERNGRPYYVISLSKNTAKGSFDITGGSALTNNVAIGDTVITVDSTLGFDESGSFYVGAGITVGIATYKSKTSTQFFGVTGISSSYSAGQFVRSSNTVYSYEEGDLKKPVIFRMTAVASGADLSNIGYLYPEDKLFARSLGNYSLPSDSRLNSWIHNVKTTSNVSKDINTGRSNIDVITNTINTTDPHLLKLGDPITLLDTSSAVAQNVEGTVSQVVSGTAFQMTVTSGTLSVNRSYKVRLNTVFASSNNNLTKVDNFVANVQNTYTDKINENVYVTSGSLPAYKIYATNRKKTFTSADVSSNKITISNHGFFTGDVVKYSPVSVGQSSIIGLSTNSNYAVTKVDDNTIRLSQSIGDVAVKRFLTISGSATTDHQIIPLELSSKQLQHQNFLRRFPISAELNEYQKPLKNESVGMFRNGVELVSNKSGDSIWYGVISDIEVQNGGSGYDVLYPPNINISDAVGTGATCYAIVENGSFKRIEVTSGGYDIKKIPNVVITGGNGKDATAVARLKDSRTVRAFNADADVNTATDRVTFTDRHLFENGESVYYKKSTNFAAVGGLTDNSLYYLHVVNEYSVQFMNTYDDAVNGSNPINITSRSTGTNTLTSTKFRKVLDSIQVTSEGSGYSNRRAIVNNTSYPPVDFTTVDDVNSGINTANNYIFFKKHGFNDGDLVEYSSTSPISGLSTTQNYYVLRLDEDRFRVTSAGIGSTLTKLNYKNKDYVKLNNIGGAKHTFKYPDIHVSIEVVSGIANTTYSTPRIRPICQGTIVQCPITSVGSGYGSTDTINVHKRPNVTVSNGSRGIIDVVVAEGQIVRAFIKDGGGGYATPPVIQVNGDGKYAKLVATVSGGVIDSVSIVDSGTGYTQDKTSVSVLTSGTGAKIIANVRKWDVDILSKYRNNINENDDGIILTSQNENYGTKYVHAYASRKLRQILSDNIEDDFSEKTSLTHSPILGWAYDGSPIYGPYGYGTPTGGAVRRMVSSYTLVSRGNRPSTLQFPLGTFIDDYIYTADGDLDEFNGRFCKTPEFPDGVYAYFCTIRASNSSQNPFVNTREPAFPYILNGFKYKKDLFNEDPGSLQSLDILNSGELVRNTYYYKLELSNSNYDYLTKNQLLDTQIIVRNTEPTGVSTVDIILPGTGYKVGDRIGFNNQNSEGSGATAKVKTLVGKGLSTFSYNRLVVPSVKFKYENQVVTGIATTAHNLSDGDLVVIGGIGTGELSFVQGSYTIGVASVTAKLQEDVETPSVTGVTTTIKLTISGVSGSIESDDVLGIGTERLVVLSVDQNNNLYRVRRQTGFGKTHYAGESCHVDQRRFTYNVGVSTNLVTDLNRKIVFNPQSTIGFGTTAVVQSVVGVGTTVVIRVKATDGTILNDHELPPSGSTADNSISIVNHGFRTGQKLTYGAGPTGAALTVSNNLDLSDPFQLVTGQVVYAVNKSSNLLGITTTIAGIGTTTTSLYFSVIGEGTEHTFTETKKDNLGHVERFDVSVKTVLPHTLKSKDVINITLEPNTSTTRTIEYDSTSRKTLVDGYYVSAASTFVGVGTTSSVLKITDHEFDSGEKVLYIAGSSPITPLVDRGEYFVQKINDNEFRLSTNYDDSRRFGGSFIGITSFGSGVHKISRINPHLILTRGQTVGFAVSDGSLQDLRLDFYEDENFVTKYEGVGISTEIIRSGNPGSPGAKVNLKLTNNVPTPLFYKLTPINLDTIDVAKRDSQPDKTVRSGSKIIIENSVYAGSHSISTTGTDTFTYQTSKKPESPSYSKDSVDLGITTFRYTTNSPNALGGINEIDITFGGIGYRRNPGISTIITDKGKNALLRLYDDSIGKAGSTEMLKIGFEYPSDKSIQPKVDLPTIVTVSNNFVLDKVGVVTAGRNYVSPPDLIIPDAPNVQLTATLNGTSVGEVSVDVIGRGFNEVPNPPRIVAVRNSNGIGIVSTSSNGDTNFVTLNQPTNGWKSDGSDFPFAVGDRIFVEGVGTAQTTFATTGGYNSENYDYAFFTVKTRNPSASQITYSIAGLGTTGGTYDPDTSSGRVIKQKDLPTFSALLTPEPFFSGEEVTYGANGRAFVLENSGYNAVTNTLRLRSTSTAPKYGDVVKGRLSGAEGTIRNVELFEAFYNTDYKSSRVQGWQRDTGKLNNDFQKIEDSDYYQNFSYSIKSEVPIEDWKPAVDSLVHPTGYKNFSDLVVRSNSTAGFARSRDLRVSESFPPGISNLSVNIDNVKSFYTKDDFDLGGEETLSNGLSKFITLQNRRIATFINVISNKVDLIDDISPQFTGIGTTTTTLTVGLTSFRLKSNGQTLFTKPFNPADTGTVSIGSSIFRINNHNFQTGEKIKYDPGNGVYGNNRISIVSTNVIVGGGTTDFLPAEIYAIRLNNNFFSLAGLATAAERGEAFTFNGVGSGTSHSFDVLRPDDRVLIEIDEIVQAPLFRRNIDFQLDEAVGVASTTIKVVGITSMTVNDLVNIDNEILQIKTVGFGSTNVLKVERGVLGSVAAAHTVGAACTMRGGTFHILKDVIHFVSPPYGKVGVTTLNPGISTNSTFQGRVFNRKDPTTNFIFDDLSNKFTGSAGAGKTFTLLQDGVDVTGIVTTKNGPEVVNQGVILINNIFQRPEIDFVMQERLDPGIGASVIFSGDDRESLPRGGIVNEYTVGFGSGYQPLERAAAVATINGAGSIESVTITGGGSGYRSGPVPIQVLNPLGIGSTAILQGTVGAAGSVTGITTVSGGTGYASTNPPVIIVGVDTGYSDVSYTGGSGSGFRASIVVGSGGSVVDFSVTDPGIGYKNGEVLTVAGIPTNLSAPSFIAHTVTVNSIISDSFAGFSFGQLLELDSFADQFDGNQTTFTLTRTTTNKDVININTENTSIDVANNLLVFLNDVLQQPGQSYEFKGGTQITFSEPPKAGSKLQILFFRGSNDDVDDGSPFPTVKQGDLLQLQRKGNYLRQTERRVTEIAGVQKVETILYNGVGINEDRTFARSVSWTKQTSDLILNNQALAKNRTNLVAKINPTAQIIQSVGVNSNEIYVDNAFPLFSALDNRSTPNEVPGTGIKLLKANNVDRADGIVSVSAGGTVAITTVTDPGSGYINPPTVSFASTIPQIREIGKTWTQRSGGSYIDFKSVTRNVFGLFVGVGTGTGIVTSTNGTIWYDSGNSTSFGDLNGVVGMNTHTIIVGASGTVGYATDGRNFQPAKTFRLRNQLPLTFFDDITVTTDFKDVTFGATIGVAVGAGGTIAYTKAGAAGFGTAFVVTQRYTSQNLNGVGSRNNVFVAVGDNGTIMRSTDGQSWSGVSTSTITTNLNAVAHGNGQWIAVGAGGSVIRSSDNGLRWTVVSAGATFDLNTVGYANSVWVAVGQSGMVLNSVDTNTWYKKYVGTGTDFNGISFGDNKFVTLGLSSSIYSSEFEKVSAAGTATVSSAGTITSININDGGFGYDPNTVVEVLIDTEPVIKEEVTSVNVEGDYGDVVSVATSATGIGTVSPMLIFELDSDPYLDQAAFSNITKSGISVGDYFVVTNSVTGAPTTCITVGNNPIGIGTTFLDNVYLVAQTEQSNSGIVTVYCNVQGITGIGTTDFSPRIGKYSWGRLYNFQRDRLSPQAFPAYTFNGSAGINTSATVTRILGVSESYNDLDETS